VNVGCPYRSEESFGTRATGIAARFYIELVQVVRQPRVGTKSALYFCGQQARKQNSEISRASPALLAIGSGP
jgi:hypothetical protein